MIASRPLTGLELVRGPSTNHLSPGSSSQSGARISPNRLPDCKAGLTAMLDAKPDAIVMVGPCATLAAFIRKDVPPSAPRSAHWAGRAEHRRGPSLAQQAQDLAQAIAVFKRRDTLVAEAA